MKKLFKALMPFFTALFVLHSLPARASEAQNQVREFMADKSSRFVEIASGTVNSAVQLKASNKTLVVQELSTNAAFYVIETYCQPETVRVGYDKSAGNTYWCFVK